VAADRDDIATAAVFRALADPTRRRILQDLRKGELAAGDIASRFPISGPSVSRHLAVLKAAGLLTERRQANKVIYSLVPDRLALCVGSFLSAVCPEEMLARHQGKKKPKAPEKVSAKSTDKPSGKDKRRRALVKPVSSPANLATDQVSATV
jgi:DNA-binding transcriptional ArsR family regulator